METGLSYEDEVAEFNKYDNMQPPFTQNDVKNALKHAVKFLYEYSYYAPLIDRYPIKVDDDIPKMRRDGIKEHETCACTDDNFVYVMTDYMTNILNEICGDADNRKSGIDCTLVSNMAAILAHEYTHILCRHVQIGRNLGKVTQAEATCFELACEIEANRGDKIETSNMTYYNPTNAVYKASVTDKKIPETAKDKYLPQIYETLLNMYNQQQQMLEQLVASIKNADLDLDGDKKGNKNGKENTYQVQGEPQNNDSKSNDNGNSPDNNSVNRQQNKTVWRELTEEMIKDSIEKAEKVIDKTRSQGTGSEAGYGLESYNIQYKPELTAQENLRKEYDRWNEKHIKKEFAKMKGVVRGTISKNREKTYARPTRRPITGSGTLIRKGVKYEPSYSPKVLLAMDSSGSMCSTTMKEVACAIENIFKDLGKPKTGSYICKHESNVSDVKPMRNWKDVVESYYPSGGNCFAHVVEKANELGVDVVLNIGDGQDCVTRNGSASSAIRKFKNDGRKWIDVLVTSKNENRYYLQEACYDEKEGFHRDAIFLGNEISKYLK